MTKEERIEDIRQILQRAHPHLINRLLAAALVESGYYKIPAVMDFCSVLSLKLGYYMASGLMDNYPENFNKMMPRIAEEILEILKDKG